MLPIGISSVALMCSWSASGSVASCVMSWRRRSGRTASSRRRATRSVLGGEHVCLRPVALAGCAELGIVGGLLAHVGLQQPYRLTSRRRHEPAGTAYASRRHPMCWYSRVHVMRTASRRRWLQA